MTATVAVEVFEFDELSDRAQENALNNWAVRQSEDADFIMEHNIDCLREDLANDCFDVKNVYFNVGGNGPEGVSFTGTVVLLDWASATLQYISPELQEALNGYLYRPTINFSLAYAERNPASSTPENDFDNLISDLEDYLYQAVEDEEIEESDADGLVEELRSFGEDLENWVKDREDYYYDQFRREWEYQTGVEGLTDWIDSGAHYETPARFFADGEIYYPQA